MRQLDKSSFDDPSDGLVNQRTVLPIFVNTSFKSSAAQTLGQDSLPPRMMLITASWACGTKELPVNKACYQEETIYTTLPKLSVDSVYLGSVELLQIWKNNSLESILEEKAVQV